MTFPLQKFVTIVPVLDLAAHADGDVLFTDMVLAEAAKDALRSTALMSIAIMDRAAQSMAFDLFFFYAEPATGTYTPNGAFTLDDADALFFAGHVNITADDYAEAAASSVATKRNIGLQMTSLDGDLYVIGVARDAHDFVAADDMQIIFEFMQD